MTFIQLSRIITRSIFIIFRWFFLHRIINGVICKLYLRVEVELCLEGYGICWNFIGQFDLGWFWISKFNSCHNYYVEIILCQVKFWGIKDWLMLMFGIGKLNWSCLFIFILNFILVIMRLLKIQRGSQVLYGLKFKEIL